MLTPQERDEMLAAIQAVSHVTPTPHDDGVAIHTPHGDSRHCPNQTPQTVALADIANTLRTFAQAWAISQTNDFNAFTIIQHEEPTT
jgi:hypothetical protein